MKVIKNLGLIDDAGHTALILDNEYFPYYIVSGFDPTQREGEQWGATAAYYESPVAFAKGILEYRFGIGYYRMSEIATKAIDGLREDDKAEAYEYCKTEIDMDSDELEYFGFSESEEEDG